MDLNLIIDKVLHGEKQEFAEITRLCNQSLYRIAYAILKNEPDAEDVLQSTYLKAYVHLASFRRESSFKTWITRILVNECNMMLRGKKKTTTSLDSLEVLKQPSLNLNAMDLLYHQQLRHWLEQAVLSLPEKYRMVYILREVNELSTEESAVALDLTAENVKVRLHRAKSLLRENLLHHVRAQELFQFGNQRCLRMTDRVMQRISVLPAAVQNQN
jgi:RNA polymerase sigma factor (sigma-70 family)